MQNRQRMFQFSCFGCVMALAFAAIPAFSAALVLEVIVVTAQKREQSAQSIPIAIAAFSDEELRNLGMRSLTDVPNFIPNVQLFDEYGTGQPTWVIRGVGLADWSANNTPAAAIYIDDVYLTSNVMGGVGLFDLQRIEVLKGPQGALYGRNTSGGAVRVVSQRPALSEVAGYASLSYGRWDTVVAQGAVNIPLGEQFAWRLAGSWEQSGDGWQTSLANNESFGEKDRWAVRSSLLFTPSDSTEILLVLGLAKDNSETVLGRGIGVYDPLTGGFCAPLLNGTLDDSSCAMNATFYDPQLRFPDQQSADGHTTFADPINQLDNDGSWVNLQVKHQFDTLQLSSITSYQVFDYALNFDYDGSNGAFGHQLARSEIEAWSQELRLESTSDESVRWMLGIELGGDDFEEDRDFLVGDDPFISSQLGEAANLRYDQKTEHTALYGQFDWAFADHWNLGLGLRYTDESKEYRNGEFLLVFGGAPFPFQTGLQSDIDMQIWSGKLSIDWQASDNAMLYASYSRGFKSGGIFGGFPGDGAQSIQPYNEEAVDAWELGFKSQWLDNSLRVNGAVFYYDYKDVQGYLTQFSELTQSVVTLLSNIGDAEHTGAELDLAWQASENLVLQANIGWLDAEISDSDASSVSWLGTLESLEGRDRPFAPDLTYTLLGRYSVTAGQLAWSAQLDYSWRDDRFGTGLSIIEQTMFQQLEDYGLLGARLTVAEAGGQWEAALWGKNLTDENYFVNVTTDDLASWMRLPGEPMSYGVELRYNW